MSYIGKPGNSKLLGTDSAGRVRPLTIGSGLSLSGTTLSATGGGGGGSALLPVKYIVPASILTSQTTSGEYVRIGIINFDPSAYNSVDATRYIDFKAYLEVQTSGGAGLTAQLELVDLDTDVTVATLTSTATPADAPSSARKASSELVEGVDLTAALHTYEVRLRRSSGNISDTVFCSLAQFEISYT